MLPSWCCQRCREPIGYLGRFWQWCLPGVFHACSDSQVRRYAACEALNRRSNKDVGVHDRVYIRPDDDPDLKALKKQLNATRHIPGAFRLGALAAVRRAETWGYDDRLSQNTVRSNREPD